MSVAYGGPTSGYAPPGRVDFGWISESFELFKANAGVWIVAVLLSAVPVILSFIIGAIFGASTALSGNAGQLPTPNPADPMAAFQRGLTGGLPPGLSAGIRIITAIYTAWLYGGVYQTAVKQVRGEITSTADLFSGGPIMWKMLGFNIVYGLAVGIGFIFCLVPGFLLAGLLFVGYALIADGETVGNALSRSMDAMKKDMWNAAAFVFVMGLLIAVSAIPCGLGLFVTVPMFYLTAALAYRDMIGMPGIGAPASPYGAAPYGAPQASAPGVWPPPPGQAPPYGQPPAFGQAPPPSSFGQTPPPAPPRRTLGGDPIDDDGSSPPTPPATPPGGTPPR